MGISMIRTLTITLVCLTAAAGCNLSDKTEVAKEKARGDAAMAEVAKVKADASAAKIEAQAAKAELAKAKERVEAAEDELAKLKSIPAKPNPIVVNRKAAEWILSVGGGMHMVTEGKSLYITKGNKLPDGAIDEINGIDLAGMPKLTNEGIRSLAGLEWAYNLNIHGNSKLTDYAFLKGMPNLRSIYAMDCPLDDTSIANMKGLTKLEKLAIGSNFQNWVTDDGLENLKAMKFLVGLDILGTRATDIGLGHIKSLRNLTSLAIGNQGIKTEITDAGLANLAGMGKLEELIIVNVAATDASLEIIKKLSQLKRIQLVRTGISEAGIASLRMALPNCKVEFVP